MTSSIRATVIGASGYSGFELVKLLMRHRDVAIGGLFAHTSAGQRLDDVFPWLAGRLDAELKPYSPEGASDGDVAFVALPSGPAMEIVPELLDSGIRVIDLGGDFRLKDAGLYEQYYGRPCSAVDVLPRSVYGLPEWSRDVIGGAELLANPGCYPTGAILPLAPLLKQRLIDPMSISITAMSGVSGAGRKAAVDLSFCEVNETVKAYRVGSHQHIPEIRAALEAIAGHSVSFTFVPHLIPITRGIYTTTTAALADDASDDAIAHAFTEAYGAEPFVRWSMSAVPEIRNVLHTNFIDIGVKIARDEKRIVLMSAIDNLMKGAAGQAVHNMNIMFNCNETEGLY